MKIAAIGDLHTEVRTVDRLQPILESIAQTSDVLLLCGDITQNGLPSEAEALAKKIDTLNILTLAVLGNHDFDKDNQEEIKKIMQDNEIIVLDGDSYVSEDIGFAGVKGFSGGFGPYILPSFGEEISKKFAKEATNEALRLESALSHLQTEKKVVVLHYSPIYETVSSEKKEIIPFLGSTHLEEPINSFNVSAVFHGHSHFGQTKGKTSAGVPVYNVTLPLLEQISPKHPFTIIEL